MDLDFTELEELSKKAVSDFRDSKGKSETKTLGNGQIYREEDEESSERENMEGFKKLIKR